MSNRVFLFKEYGTDDRDCVRYIDLEDLKNNKVCCNGKFNVHGACYWNSLKSECVDYKNIATILTEEEYHLLCNPNGGDLTNIIKKLNSHENYELFWRIQDEEDEYLMDQYNLDKEDIERIFDGISSPYHDRSVVGYVYDDVYDLGYEEAYSFGYINDENVERYFDFEAFGNDLLMDGDYIELDDGRVVSLNY